MTWHQFSAERHSAVSPSPRPGFDLGADSAHRGVAVQPPAPSPPGADRGGGAEDGAGGGRATKPKESKIKYYFIIVLGSTPGRIKSSGVSLSSL